jgi:hypothetical protein
MDVAAHVIEAVLTECIRIFFAGRDGDVERRLLRVRVADVDVVQRVVAVVNSTTWPVRTSSIAGVKVSDIWSITASSEGGSSRGTFGSSTTIDWDAAVPDT